MQTLTGHSYESVILQDGASAQLGDSHVHHHYPRIDLKQRAFESNFELLSESLKFSRLDARLRNVASAMPHTCEWLRSHNHFLSWIDQNYVNEHSGLLWIKGKPGSGKSTIMKKTLEWAKTAWKGQVVLSYFFNARAADLLEKTTIGLYRSLVYHVLSINSEIQVSFVNEFSTKIRTARRGTEIVSVVEDLWTEQELQGFFLLLVENKLLPKLNIFVDALDEGSEHEIRQMIEFFESVSSYARSVGSVFRLCISSRYYPNISIDSGLIILLEEESHHKGDIKRYIDKAFSGKHSDALLDIKNQLLERADHVFLWVVLSVCMLKPLYDKGRVAAMRQKLEQIPIELYNLFSTLIAADLDTSDECRTLLQWMTVTYETPSVESLYAVIRVYHDSENDIDFSLSDQQDIVNYILDCSRGLVQIIPNPRVSNRLEVSFIHETVRQFLLSDFDPVQQDRIVLLQAADFHPKVRHTVAAEACLSSLIYRANFKVPRDALSQLPRYADRFWLTHLKKAALARNSKALELATKLLMHTTDGPIAWRSSICTDKILLLVSNEVRLDRRHHIEKPPLYYAARTEIPELVETLISKGLDVNEKVDDQILLHLLCWETHEAAVRLILDCGAEVDSLNTMLGTALHIVSRAGDIAIVQLLLDRGADIDIVAGEYGTALQAAIIFDNLDIVNLLLERGANANLEGGKHGSALQAAAACRHKEMVKLLLDKNVDVDIAGRRLPTAIEIASARGYETIAELILAKQAERRIPSALFRAAADNGHEGMVSMFLKRGSDMNARDKTGTTALDTAINNGNLSMVKLLLESGVREENYHGESALQAAAHQGKEKIVEMLLQKGADINICHAMTGNTALHLAVLYGSTKVVRILVEHGADVNVRNNQLNTALYTCGSHPWYAASELLRSTQTIDIDLRGIGRDHIICSAAHKQSEDFGGLETFTGLVGDLLSHRKPERQYRHRKHWGSALISAARVGETKLVEMILSSGVLEGHTYPQYWAQALRAANRNEKRQVVEFLLERPAPLSKDAPYFLDILDIAEASGYEHVVSLLVDPTLLTPFKSERDAFYCLCPVWNRNKPKMLQRTDPT